MRLYSFLLIILFIFILISCTPNVDKTNKDTESQVPYSSIIQITDSTSRYVSSNIKRKVELFTKNGTTIKVGDRIMISAVHSPTNIGDANFEYSISNEEIAQFAYDEYSNTYMKYPSNCIIEAKSSGEFQLTVFVKSNDGNCTDTITFVVTE